MKKVIYIFLSLLCLVSCKNPEIRRAENYIFDTFGRYLTGDMEVSEQEFTYYSNYILQNNGGREYKAMSYDLRAMLFWADIPDEQSKWMDDMARACMEVDGSGNERLIASIYLDYGVGLIRLGWYSTAIPVLEEAILNADRTGSVHHQIIARMNMSRAYLHLPGDERDPVMAVQYAEAATELAREQRLDVYVAKALYALSSCYSEVGMYGRSLESARESVELMRELHDHGIRKEPVRYYQLARSFYYLNEPDSALFYATKELDASEPRVKASHYRLISQIYGDLLGDDEMATYYLGEYSKFAYAQTNPHIERYVIDRLELAGELAAKQSKNLSWIFITLLASVIVLSGLAYFRYRRHIQEKDNELERNRHRLAASEADTEALRSRLSDSDPLVIQLRETPRFLTPEEWKRLVDITDKMYGGYCSAMPERGFTTNNIRLAAAVKLGFSTSDCSKFFGISPESITKAKQRLKAKLL